MVFERTFTLYDKIDVSRSSWHLGAIKTEITLVKARSQPWTSLEKSAAPSEDYKIEYPSSSRVKHDWNEVERSPEATEESKDSIDAFFKKLYADASEDTRRAMMKSFVSFNDILARYYLG